MEYIAKRAAERISAFRQIVTADWWSELSPEGQAEYLKEHPDSKKAKEVHEQRKKAQLKRPSIQSHEDQLEKEEHPDMIKHQEDHPQNIEHLHPDAQKFFKDGHDKPGSPERKAAASFFAKKSKQIAKAVSKAAKANVKEWKHGVKGLGKLFRGKSLSDHEKEGVKAIIKDVLVTAGIVMVGGGLAHGVAAAMAHVGRDVLAETFFKTVAHGLIEHGSEVASTPSAAAVEFAALVHEVIAEEETAKDKKDDKKGKSKTKPPAKKTPPKKPKADDSDDEADEESGDSSEDGASDESSDPGMEAEADSDGDEGSSEDEGELDPETAEAVEKVVQFLAKFAEDGKIPKEAWMAAASEEPMGDDGKVFPDQEPAADEEEGEGASDEEGDEDVNDEEGESEGEDDEDEEPEGDGSTIEDKVTQKDPDDAPSKPKLKDKKPKDKKSEKASDDEDEEDDEEDEGFNSADEGNDSE